MEEENPKATNTIVNFIDHPYVRHKMRRNYNNTSFIDRYDPVSEDEEYFDEFWDEFVENHKKQIKNKKNVNEIENHPEFLHDLAKKINPDEKFLLNKLVGIKKRTNQPKKGLYYQPLFYSK